mmetsp:Transcript_22902/g.72527  ORF Transcript_22902/g.72527 Transcript_22902/m.72527 type:complete len:497 (+) Transcript_22902:352-1842(+)
MSRVEELQPHLDEDRRLKQLDEAVQLGLEVGRARDRREAERYLRGKLKPVQPKAERQRADRAVEPCQEQLHQQGRHLATSTRLGATRPRGRRCVVPEPCSQRARLAGREQHPAQHPHEALREGRVLLAGHDARGGGVEALGVDAISLGAQAIAEPADDELAAAAERAAVLGHQTEEPVARGCEEVARESRRAAWTFGAGVSGSLVRSGGRRGSLGLGCLACTGLLSSLSSVCALAAALRGCLPGGGHEVRHQPHRFHGDLRLGPHHHAQGGVQQPVAHGGPQHLFAALAEHQLGPAKALEQDRRAPLLAAHAVRHGAQHGIHHGLNRELRAEELRGTAKELVGLLRLLPDLSLAIVQAVERPSEQDGHEFPQARPRGGRGHVDARKDAPAPRAYVIDARAVCHSPRQGELGVRLGHVPRRALVLLLAGGRGPLELRLQSDELHDPHERHQPDIVVFGPALARAAAAGHRPRGARYGELRAGGPLLRAGLDLREEFA